MISAVALLTAPARPSIVEVPDPASPTVTIQALVRLPRLNDAERFCALAAWDTVLEGSEEYSRLTLRAYSQQAGRAISAAALPDHLILRVTFPKEQLSTGVSMVESMLRRPLFNREDVERAIARRHHTPSEAWQAALKPENWSEGKPTLEEVRSVYRRLVRPENTVIAFGGGFDSARLTQELSRFDDWSPPVERSTVREWAARAKPLMKVSGPASTFELTGPSGSADASIALDFVTATALGVGKGSTLHQVAREKHGWSYRQEGFLEGTPEGVRVRLILARSTAENAADFLAAWREEMRQAVKGWTQADRTRAVALLRSWLLDGLGVSPLRLIPEGRVVASLEEKTHLAAWWRMKFGAPLDAERVLAQAEKVTLDDLKANADRVLEQASARFLIGTP